MDEKIPALKASERNETGKPRSRKLLAILFALVAIVLVVLFFRSSLSKIQDIVVEGAHHATPEQVKAVLGASPGDSFFVPSSDKLAARVRKLGAVKEVAVKKSFPGKLTVAVTEYKEVAAQLDDKGNMSAVLENGLVVPYKAGTLPNKPLLTDWKADDPNWKALCKTLGLMPEGLLTDLSEVRPVPSKSYPDRIKLYTRSRFEVVTTVSKLSSKIVYLSDIVENREPGRVVLLEADTYTPYSAGTP